MEITVDRVYNEKANSDLYYGVPEPFVDTDVALEEDDVPDDPLTAVMKASSSETYVKTPNGSKVNVIKYSYKGDAWANTLTNQYKKAYPLATLLRNADNRYNCHSYAWYKQKTGNKYWMNSPKEIC